MASEQKFVDFVIDQIGYLEQVTNKKMLLKHHHIQGQNQVF